MRYMTPNSEELSVREKSAPNDTLQESAMVLMKINETQGQQTYF